MFEDVERGEPGTTLSSEASLRLEDLRQKFPESVRINRASHLQSYPHARPMPSSPKAATSNAMAAPKVQVEKAK